MTNELEAFEDPGLPVHAPRAADIDPRAEARAEQQVALLFWLSAFGSALLIY